jgi:hypothetical protein
MHKLQIKEFTVQAHSDFQRPLFVREAEIHKLADQMLAAFPHFLRMEDIDLFAGKPPYGYQLIFKMLRGSADVVVTSKTVTSTFRDGRSFEAAQLVSQCIDAIYKIAVTRPIVINRLLFGAHAEFESPEAFEIYMAGFKTPDEGYLSGGKILRSTSTELKGEMRYSTEGSLGYKNSIYVTADFFTPEELTTALLDKMSARFNEVSAFEGLEISLFKESKK